jgi:transposase-like protein
MRQAGDATLFIERRRKVSKAKRERGKEEGSEPRVYRRHPIGLKQQAVERMNLGENVSALARELGVDRINLYRWRAELIKVPSGEPGVTYDPQQQRIQELEAKIAGLEGTLGRKEMELDFFAGAWRRIKGTRQQRSISGETASTRKSAEGCKRKAE